MESISRRDFIKHSMIMGTGAMTLPTVLKSTAVSADDPPGKVLLCPPYLGCPTRSSILLNLVSGEKAIECHVRFGEAREALEGEWEKSEDISMEPMTVRQIRLEHLKSDTEYRYQLFTRLKDQSGFQMLMENPFRTQRTTSSAFSFALFSDAHIYPFQEALDRHRILNKVTSSILTRRPDLSLMLGDNIQTFTSHGGPMIEKRYGGILYAHLRYALGALPSSTPLFNTIGNWEGENGWHPERERGWARQARMTWVPTPDPETYPEGGSEFGDYYGFRWGDALFLVLNVSGYTSSDHAMQSPIGRADDWTLGEGQKQWLHKRLSTSKAKWKFLFLHHPVGGKAGDDLNSRYGRGGGRAAHTGEQALIHEWMKTYGVQVLFYGHDHVFTDIPVDGIHYICVGSAGAPWKFTEEETGYKTFWTPSGYTWVDVHKTGVKVSFVQPDLTRPEGKVLHSFEIS